MKPSERTEAIIALGEAALARAIAEVAYDYALTDEEPDEATLDNTHAAFEEADEAYRVALLALGVRWRPRYDPIRAAVP